VPHALPTYSSRFDHPNNNWWAAQVRKLLITLFSPFFCHLRRLWGQNLPQHPILKYRQLINKFYATYATLCYFMLLTPCIFLQ
jgi:hypothetical protein